MATDALAISHRTVNSGGVDIHCAFTGPADGKMIVLLHGFPAWWTTWREIMPRLAAQGFFVVAPDLRGAGESGKPAGLEPYAMTHFVADVEAVAKAFGRDKIRLAGHDIGGGVTWATAMQKPELVERLSILNSVHPVGFRRQLKKFSQLRRSWYIFLFQIGGLPEWMASKNDYAFLRGALTGDGLSKEVAEDLLGGVRPEGAIHAMINWYRATARGIGATKPAPVDIPSLIIWGDKEAHLDPELAYPPADFVSNTRTEHVPEAGHWIPLDAPARVAELLVEHFR